MVAGLRKPTLGKWVLGIINFGALRWFYGSA